MSDFHYVTLYATFTGFRVMVMANRLACDNRPSRDAHDALIDKLGQLIALTQRTIAAERELALNPDSPAADDLGEAIWGAGQDLVHHWRDPDGTDLLHNDVHVDWATNEWYDARTGEWRFLDGHLPPRIEIGDDRLNGLGGILRQIRRETGIQFNTYTTDRAYMTGDAGEDPARRVAMNAREG